ncbi:Bug family tripartite tricarboxylate transporter substrate binding protein [Rhodoplanes roseus]|uniref:Tripartite tricarboxylate transporter substrate binding protein n=1 Tax=Rhodoplanes roseus TaxID=29409 RepID=A0A327L7E7_9BRAD|nr:tripartite tricarboxylate transporter substrate binding protein [Rhodoplanes roseus]RAI45985.1 hypothetical protein CH341_01340 [Rhodoplanes roseus]
MKARRMLLPLIAACGFAAAAAAQTYPARPVTVIVPYPAGGATDIVARLISQGLSEEFKQSLVVDNKGGGAGMIGMEVAARSEPDGYTLLVSSTGPATISPLLHKDGEFKPLERLEPVVSLASAPAILLVRNDLPAKTVDELIALSKKTPGSLNMASAGAGSLQRLVGEVFQDRTGVKWTHVPFRGSAPALNELIAGRVDVMVDVVPSAAPFVQAGKMRALAVMAPQRSAQLPDVPTLAELGRPGLEFSGWHGLFAPAGTPRGVIDTLNATTNRILKLPSVQAGLAAIGASADGGPPEDLRRRMEQELRNWADVIRKAGITVTD